MSWNGLREEVKVNQKPDLRGQVNIHETIENIEQDGTWHILYMKKK